MNADTIREQLAELISASNALSSLLLSSFKAKEVDTAIGAKLFVRIAEAKAVILDSAGKLRLMRPNV